MEATGVYWSLPEAAGGCERFLGELLLFFVGRLGGGVHDYSSLVYGCGYVENLGSNPFNFFGWEKELIINHNKYIIWKLIAAVCGY